MKKHEKIVLVISLISIAILLRSCVSSFNSSIGLEDDNIIEESLEEVIYQQTGLEIDLTPKERTDA